MKIGLLAGEASGDLLGANLLVALKKAFPNLSAEGIGGPHMIEAGCHSLFDIEILSVMGLWEPLLRLPELFRLRHNIYHHFLKNPPDVFIGIDAPEFNLGLEVKLRRAGIPVIHYVSPSVWAWRQNRVKKIAKAVDLMLTLFPFETKFYEKHHIPVQYIGHPLAQQISLQPDKKAARRALCLDETGTYIALLPGSRRQEIRHLAEPFLKAAEKLWHKKPELRFLTTHANEARYQEFYDQYQQLTPQLPLTFYTHRSQEVIAASDFVIVASGTATLEAMLHKKPMIIAYRMPKLAFAIAKRLVKVPYIGLPNLLSGREVVPELIQENATAQEISARVLDFLTHPEKMLETAKQFEQLHQELTIDSNQIITQAISRIIRTV